MIVTSTDKLLYLFLSLFGSTSTVILHNTFLTYWQSNALAFGSALVVGGLLSLSAAIVTDQVRFGVTYLPEDSLK